MLYFHVYQSDLAGQLNWLNMPPLEVKEVETSSDLVKSRPREVEFLLPKIETSTPIIEVKQRIHDIWICWWMEKHRGLLDLILGSDFIFIRISG